MNVYCLLFDNYETLDLMGVVEFLYHCPDVHLHYVSYQGGLIKSRQGFFVKTDKLDTLTAPSVLVVPGGQGTRPLVGDEPFLKALSAWVSQCTYCLSICTGSALLAKANCLDGVRATSNKKSFDWVAQQSDKVHWQKVARWVKDDKFYVSSGVSAGMDMALAFIADKLGMQVAQHIANHCEYHWQQDPNQDDFAKLYL